VRKGTLVEVLSRNRGNNKLLGEVIEYRSDVLGGSAVQSWRGADRQWRQEFTTAPRRGEVLILTYDDGGMSWFDEQDVRVLPHPEDHVIDP